MEGDDEDSQIGRDLRPISTLATKFILSLRKNKFAASGEPLVHYVPLYSLLERERSVMR